MRIAQVFLITLVLASVTRGQSIRADSTALQISVTTVKQEPLEDTRRCAYLGRWGSFHIVDAGGTAAYMLGRDQYIADLQFAREDKSFWYYRPVANGDAATTMWAFARKPYCGRYWVWRESRGRWQKYELTRAWGIGIGEDAAFSPLADTSPGALRAVIDDHEERIKALENQRSAIRSP